MTAPRQRQRKDSNPNTGYKIKTQHPRPTPHIPTQVSSKISTCDLSPLGHAQIEATMKKKWEKVKQDERREWTKLPLKSNPRRSKDRNMPKNITHIPDENPVAGSQEVEPSKTQMKVKNE